MMLISWFRKKSFTIRSFGLFGVFQGTFESFRFLCYLASWATLGLLFWILIELVLQAWPAMVTFKTQFLIGRQWIPNRNVFGVFPFLIGTVVSSCIALGLAMPLGLSIAIFLSEDFLPLFFRSMLRFMIELLAAIPSVVYGLWGIFVVVPWVQTYGPFLSETLGTRLPFFQGPVFGNSLLTASLVLGLMVLPTVTAISRSALSNVSDTLREGSYALGATRWETLLRVIVPAAAPGILAAFILALGRAMGETMAVAMLIGNSPRLAQSLFAPTGTLSALLANEFSEAQGMQISALMYAALLLVLLTVVVNWMGTALLRRVQRHHSAL